MSTSTVREVFDRIQRLSPRERLLLDELLAESEEQEWQREAVKARRAARERGIDQAAIDRAVDQIRYGA